MKRANSRAREFAVCDAMRDQLLKRANYECEKCKSAFRLHIHHQRYRVPCRTNDFEVLCEDCHRSRHNEREDICEA